MGVVEMALGVGPGADDAAEAGALAGATVRVGVLAAGVVGAPVVTAAAGVAGAAGVLAAVLALPVPAAALDVTGPQADTASPMPRPNTTIPVTGVARVKSPRLILAPLFSSKGPDILGDDARES
jgi:hypothetical protein